ncbi:MAG: hypothetical protein WDN28_06880 [Chthoniobacter sp.]
MSRRVGADEAKGAGGDVLGELFEERGLAGGGQVVEHIEKDDVAAEIAGGESVTDAERDVAVGAPGDELGLGDFRRIEINANQRRKKASLAQIELK